MVSLDRSRPPDPSNRPNSRSIVRIHLLGAMRATSYLGDDVLPRGRKARAVLGCLCLAAGACVPRSRLAAMLWDRVPDFQGRASFRQAFRELVVAFGPLAEELILADREMIRLNTSLCWIDALAVLAPEQPPKSPRADLAALCKGELLEELGGVSISFDQWLLSERSQFNERLRSLLEDELKQAHRENSEAEERADIARRLIRFDPTHEGASRILMRAFADMGERAQALREYVRLRDELHRSLDVEPSPETHALYDAIRTVGRGEKEKEPEPVASRQRRAKPVVSAMSRNRLRVGVLPFLASGAEESLALSMSQEVAAALARFRWFDVIAPVMLMTRGTIMPISEDPLRQNELDYVVDGALSSDGNKSQVSVRLLDLKNYASPVWSNRFELSCKEPHFVDEELIAKIAGRIDPVILFIEGQPKRHERLEATGLLLRAQPLLYSMEREKYEEAGSYIKQALALEPENPMASAWMAYWQLFYVGQGWPREPAKTIAVVQEHAQRAIRLDPDNAEALAIYAHVCAFAHKNFDDALHYFDRALRLNPNLAFAWALSAATYCYIGDPDTAFQRLERYRDLAPFHPYFILLENVFVTAHFLKGDYEQAAIVGRRVVMANPKFVNGYKPLLAALGQLGKIDEAGPHVETLLQLEPNFTLQRFARDYPLKRELDRTRYMEGLRLAGVPEG